MNKIEDIGYPKSQLKSRILHLGFGAFHRAHQALIADEVARKSDSDWGYCEVNLVGGEQLIADLKAQELQYSVLEKGQDTNTLKRINAVCQALHPELDGQSAVLEKMADPEIAIVSMTITEKGYCIDPSTGKLDLNNSYVKQDLANIEQPQSALGYIVRALMLRRERGIAPFTVMSCDNVMENGAKAKSAVVQLAAKIDPALSQWIEQNVPFPCTMVDRIVPAATPETLEQIATILGHEDPCGIACEDFLQWVVEDHFVDNQRPQWELAGAQLVDDVRPFEQMKLRMLNGAHSFLAYLGYLGGYAHISDTMQDDNYRAAALKLMLKEQAPTLSMPEGTDLDSYAHLLIARFTNPSLKHQTYQIATDGSQKLPPRMLESISYHLSKGSDFSLLALGVAGWCRYVAGVNEQGEAFEVHDPMAAQFAEIYQKCGLGEGMVDELLNLSAIFPGALQREPHFVNAVKAAYAMLLERGAKATVAHYLTQGE
ncbi:fructuronate reductase [Pasteurellaceae bacterium 20609_3]|uniref:mannitol dehydrogenase family protein n=1 Tax=Spirabiliibacterium mucosae TaxID=28156 RepID=UPI001AAD7E34|nr:fructuronate reductase [Spirabiliibacterium mucosae]MBE2897934.1 fructuronate reductase [Spirabiliibacterium mucosae]